MLATISFHVGHEARQAHNRRDLNVVRNEKHIDLSRPHENIIDIDEAEAYEQLFGAAQDEYNAKQKRKDRRIDDYHATIREPYDAIIAAQRAAKKFNEDNKEAIKSGEITPEKVPEIPRTMKKPLYETIIGLYYKAPRIDDNGNQVLDPRTGAPIYDSVPTPPDIARRIILEFLNGFIERNKHLCVIGSYLHYDERGEAPHIHINWIPFADGYTRGLSRQVALDRALRQQGIESTEYQSTLEIWTQREREELERIATSYGIEVIHPQAKTGARHKDKFELQQETTAREIAIKKAEKERTEQAIKQLDEKIDEAMTQLDKLSSQAAQERLRVQAAKQAAMNAERARRDLKQDIADYASKLTEMSAEFEAERDASPSIKIKRALRAMKHTTAKNGCPAIDYFAKIYERNKSIPRIQEDIEAAELRRAYLPTILPDDEDEDEQELLH